MCSTGLKQCGRWYVSILVTWLHALTVSFSASIDGSHVRSKTTIKAFTNYLLSNNIAEFFFLNLSVSCALLDVIVFDYNVSLALTFKILSRSLVSLVFRALLLSFISLLL